MIRYVWALAVCAVTLGGQTTTGISGLIEDPQGRTVPGARLHLYRLDTRASLNTISSEAGSFHFEDLAPGAFFLEVGREGFQTATIPVGVEGGSVKNVDVKLALAGVSQQVVITAADQAQPLDEVSKAISIVSQEEIMHRDPFALSDIISTVPGIQIFNGGGPGQNTSIRMRGLQPDAGAVLIDGLRFRDASTLQSDASSFVSSLNFIAADHVEVLRGSGSSLYGTNAVGGAVNVVTDQGGGPTHGDLQVEGGNLGFFRTRGSLGGGAFADRLRYTVGILHLNVMSGVDGQDANRSSGLQSFARYDLDSRVNVSARFWGSDDFVQVNNSPSTSGIPSQNIPATGVIPAIPLSAAGRAALLAGQPVNYGSATFVPGVNDPDNRRSSRFFNSAFVFRDTVSSRLNWQASYQRVYTNRVYQNGPVGVGYQPAALSYGDYKGIIHTLNVHGTAQVGSWMNLTGGYEWERERYSDHQDNNLPAPTRIIESTQAQQDSNAAYFASQISLANRRLQIGLSGRAQSFNLSRPDFQYAGTANNYATVPLNVPRALTGDASVAYLLSRLNTKVRAHVGNAYRAPSLYERFGAGFSTNFVTGLITFTPYGDPRLAPNRYNSGDAGIDQYLFGSRVRMSATAFYTRVVHITAFDSSGAINPATDPYGRTAGYMNGSGGISRGAELSIEARPTKTLTVSGSYTYTNSDTDRDITVRSFYQVFLAPAHTATVVATKQWRSRLDTTVDVVHYSSYYNSLFAGLSSRAFLFPAFTKADLVGSYRFWNSETKSARFYAKVDNLLNQTYYPSGFINPGATFVTGIGYSF